MMDRDIVNDILQHKKTNQRHYNECLLNNRNPEVRSCFTVARDDETRDIVLLQQKFERIKNNTRLIEKIFSSKD